MESGAVGYQIALDDYAKFIFARERERLEPESFTEQGN